MSVHDDVSKVMLYLDQDLNDNIFVNELKNGKKGVEFSIEPPPQVDSHNLDDLRVDTAYEYDQYVNHVNLDCLNVDDSEDSNTSPFDIIAIKMFNLTPDGGIKKKILRSGAGLKVPEKGVVNLHYNSYFELEEIPFDSSYLRTSRSPEKYCIGKGNYYFGFELAVLSMAQGEKSQFLISSKYAFGSMGVPPRIPPNATILLEIDLVNIICSEDPSDELPAAPDIEDFKEFNVAFKKAKNAHACGNDYFSHGNYNSAINCYKKSVNLLTSCSMYSDEQEKNQQHLLMKAYRNLCICYNKVNIPQKVCIYAREAVHLNPLLANLDAKLHFNWGKALTSLDLKKAGDHLRKAQTLEPNNTSITKELIELNRRIKEEKEHEKITYKKALGLDKNENIENPDSKDQCLTDPAQASLVNDIIKFSKSSQSRLEFPPGLTKEEKNTIEKTAKELGLTCHIVKSEAESYLAISKCH